MKLKQSSGTKLMLQSAQLLAAVRQIKNVGHGFAAYRHGLPSLRQQPPGNVINQKKYNAFHLPSLQRVVECSAKLREDR